MTSTKTLFVRKSGKPTNKKRHLDNGQYISKLQSVYLDQISGSSEFVLNVLENCSAETSFGK